MRRRLSSSFFAVCLSMLVVLPAAALADHDGNPDYVDDCDGCWKAPDVAVTFGSDFLTNQSNQAGPTFEVTIGDFWEDGHCYYDTTNNFEPDDDCDRLRFGLGLYRGPDSGGSCPVPAESAVPPQEDGGALLTDGYYKVSTMQTKAGDAYCSHTDERTLGDSLLDYRDKRLDELGTDWPDRAQLILNVIKELPQTDDSTQDQVRESLLAACELYDGNGGQHLSMPSWMMTTKDSTPAVDLFAGMMSAAGGTGQCCYNTGGGGCDPSDPAGPHFIDDMCLHLADSTHSESQLRSDIDDGHYQCSASPKLTSPGAMLTDEFSEVKCQLNGSSCGPTDDPAMLWPVFSCIQTRPSHIAPQNFSVEYCGSIDGDIIDEDWGDENGNGCITLTPGNGIEWVDPEHKNLYYLSADSFSFPDENGNVFGDRVQTAVGSGRTASATFGQQPAEGNLLVAISAHRVDWTTPEMLSDGWTLVDSVVDNLGDNNRRRGLAIWYKVAEAGEPTTVETTWSGGGSHSGRHNTLIIEEFSGDYTLDVYATHSSGSTEVNSINTGATAEAADSSALIIGAMAMREQGDAASWTNGLGDNLRAVSSNYGAPSPTTIQTATRTSSTAQSWQSTASWGGTSASALGAIVVFSGSHSQPDVDDDTLCRGIAEGDSWTNVVCPGAGQLCELDDGSNCSVGRFACINDTQVCERYPGNDDTCDVGSCGEETVHETGLVQPNVLFLIDRSGSMVSGTLWQDTKQLMINLADWSYQDPGCEDDGTNCDMVRLGMHFWSGQNPSIYGGDDEIEVVSPDEDTTPTQVGQAFDDYWYFGGTEFHQASRLAANEAGLDDPDRPNVAVFVTDGIAENAFTTREAVREFCDLKSRPDSPIATHAVGFYQGNPGLTSIIAAAGGTGTCCYSTDDDCDGETAVSPCQLYQYERDHGVDIVSTFETWLENERPGHHTQWSDLNTAIATDSHTADAYRRGTVADDLDMVADVARWLLYNDEGVDPDTLDCTSDSGDKASSNGAEFYKWVVCETEKTLSHVVRHKYGNDSSGDRAKDVSSWSDFDDVYLTNHDSTFLDHNYTCAGAMFQDDPADLYDGLHALISGMECSYPLSLLDGDDSAPENTDATYVKLYLPAYGTVLRVPHNDDSSGKSDFQNELCSTLGLSSSACSSYDGSSWEFTNTGRTAVQLTDELCELTKTDAVEKSTTQVCRLCDADQVGEPCEWVDCIADDIVVPNETAYNAEGHMCIWKDDRPCPDDPDQDCPGWVKTGRCGQGQYACDDNGLPTCEQVRSPMPEICNGVDDSCDGNIDNMSDNPSHPQWSQSDYDITGEPYDGWYCGNRDTCRCPGGDPDSIGGTASDPDEFTSMMEHQQANGQCECGEGIRFAEQTTYEPTRSGPDTGEPQACSSTGDAGPSSLLTVALGLLLGVFGLRRRKWGKK